MAISQSHSVGRADLAQAFMETALDESHYVGEAVSPTITQGKRAGYFPAITRESISHLPANIQRSTDGAYRRTNFQTEDKEFRTEAYGMEMALDDHQVAELQRDYGIDADEAAAKIVFHHVLRVHEKRIADAFFNTTTFSAGNGNFTDVSGSNPWGTVGSDIISTIQAAQEAVFDKCGIIPMDVVMNWKVFRDLLRNTQLRGVVGDNRDKTIQTMQSIIAPAIGVERIHIAHAVYNGATGAPASTFTASNIWSTSYAQVFVNGTSGDLGTPRLGATVLFDAVSPLRVNVLEYESQETSSHITRAYQMVDDIVVDSAFGHLLQIA